jgi:hypothetical protein
MTSLKLSGKTLRSDLVSGFPNIGQWDPLTTTVGLSTAIFMIILKRFEQTEKLAAIIYYLTRICLKRRIANLILTEKTGNIS